MCVPCCGRVRVSRRFRFARPLPAGGLRTGFGRDETAPVEPARRPRGYCLPLASSSSTCSTSTVPRNDFLRFPRPSPLTAKRRRRNNGGSGGLPPDPTVTEGNALDAQASSTTLGCAWLSAVHVRNLSPRLLTGQMLPLVTRNVIDTDGSFITLPAETID